MKRELERISGAGSVNVDSPRVKRQKETVQTAMPATTSESNNVASDPSVIMNGWAGQIGFFLRRFTPNTNDHR